MTEKKQYDIEIETAVIGAILCDKTAINRCILQPEYFYDHANRDIFSAILKLNTENKPIDMLTVNDITGSKYITELAKMTSRVSSSANIEYHSSIVYERYINRKMVDLCQRTIKNIMNSEDDVFKIIQGFNTEIDGFSLKTVREFKEFRKIAVETIKEVENIQESGKSVNGIDTGFRALNSIMHGWHSPDFVVIAARPATGKTAFALNLAHNIAAQNIPCAFFSCEMSTKQLAIRMISAMSGIYGNYISTGNLYEGQWNDIMKQNYDLPIYIDDTPSLNIMDFKEKARKAKKKWGIKAIFVDYLQLLTVYGKGNREQEISTISRTFKAIAKELDVAVISLAQLSRDVEKSNREPRLSDLRESGAIEQDADIVIALHNEAPESDTPNIKVIYLKHRNGQVGYVTLNFNKGIQKFLDI